MPHITLKSIANNAEIDVIWEKWQEKLEPLRGQLIAEMGKRWQEWEIPREAEDPWNTTTQTKFYQLKAEQARGEHANTTCCQGRGLGHDLGHGLRGPVERMRMLIPFVNELVELRTQVVFGFKIHDSQAFALEDTEPLFHLIHPGAMHGGEVHDKAWMLG